MSTAEDDETVSAPDWMVEEDRRFQAVAFGSGLNAAASSRFWVFPEMFEQGSGLPQGAFVSFGSSAGLQQDESQPTFFHTIHAVARMPRVGWLNLVKALNEQLHFSEEEIAYAFHKPDQSDQPSDG